ncbi:MAG TPA: carbonic anhydrase [Solirubrobacteraceae bacterium]|nr:carbonic anhydrase [Solirubrobacteraceae bacterium]
MPHIDPALERNREFAASGAYRDVAIMPKLNLFVVTCLDPRVDPAAFLGIGLGDAAVLRNAGGRVTDEVVREISFISQLVEGAIPDGPLFEVAVVHHTQCATGALADDDFRNRYADRIGADADSLIDGAVLDPEATVRADVERLRAARSVSERVSISGHVYDVTTGLVATVLRT